jgi:ferredoxin
MAEVASRVIVGLRLPWEATGGPVPILGVVMRVVVDFDLCESNAVCMNIAPEVFEVRDDDFLYVLQEEPDESLRAKIQEAVTRCPKQAIALDG